MKGPSGIFQGMGCGSPGVSRSVRSLEGVSRWLVIIAAAVAPWLFGASEPWAVDLVSMVAFAGAICWLVSVAACPPACLRARGVTVILLLLLALLGLQVVPLPPGLIKALSPFSASAGTRGLELLRSLGLAPDGETVWTVLSVAPGATRAAIALFSMYFLAFLVVANGTHHWSDVRRMAGVVIGSGFALVFISLVHGLTHSRELLWFHVPRHMQYGFGPFANRNHFATHAMLLFGLACGSLLAAVTIPALRGAEWRERLLFLLSRGAGRLAMLGVIVIVTAVSVFLSLSRGAIVSLMLAVGAAMVLWSISGGARGSGRYPAAAAILLVFALVVWLGWEPVAARLSTLAAVAREPVGDCRVMAASDTLTLFGLSPFVGLGFGSFQYVFPVVARPELDFGRWIHTHNDWIEWLAEGGVVGGFLVALLVWLSIRYVRTNLPDVPVERRRFVQGCLIGMGAVAIHSVVDFGLRKPANGLLFAVLAGLVVAALRRPQNQAAVSEDEPQEAPASAIGAGNCATRLRIVACVALVTVVGAWSGSISGFHENLAFKRFERLERIYNQTDDPVLLEAVVANARSEAFMCSRLGSMAPELLMEVVATQFRWAMDRRLSEVTRRLLEEDAVTTALLPVRAAPTDFSAWLWLGRGQALVGRWSSSDQCLERAAELHPRGPPPRLLPHKH